jgi:hypothetical protein
MRPHSANNSALASTPHGMAVAKKTKPCRPHVRLRTGRPVSQYTGSEDCAGSVGAAPHAGGASDAGRAGSTRFSRFQSFRPRPEMGLEGRGRAGALKE